MRKDLLPQGADLIPGAVRYRTWASEARNVQVRIWRGDQAPRTLELERDASGYHHCADHHGIPGDLYKFILDGQEYPDPASRSQPEGVHGRSQVIDPAQYPWRELAWRPHPLRDLSIYELHIGTFTPEGTFRSAIAKLDHIRELGVTAIEIMPIADFAGSRNWGYDGVCLYAPSHSYGTPDDLRALVDAAHGHGLTVILDVVYNHLGPDGNYLGAYAPGYIDEERKTPWGGALRIDDSKYRPLRALFVANPLYWLDEFHIDGFRLDATHAILDESPMHILAEMTRAIHEHGGFAIAEDSRNDSRVILPVEENGTGFDALWADDFHHTIRVSNTGEDESYLGDFSGTLQEQIETLRNGWFFRGQYSPSKGGNRGSECRHLAPRKFVHCISNHDQAGNQPMGQRINHAICREAYLAASALLCLTPYTPLIFMGQEWATSTPFIFFTDHNEELGKLITKGRREEFKAFSAFGSETERARIPDPQAEKTFNDSKLIWDEVSDERKSQTLQLYRTCLGLRNQEAGFRPNGRDTWHAEALAMGAGALRLKGTDADWLMLFDLKGGNSGSLAEEWICKARTSAGWSVVLSTTEKRFGCSGSSAVELPLASAQFNLPELVLLKS